MEVLELTIDDAVAATDLWAETGLTRPWNDPTADFLRAIEGPSSAVLGAKKDGALLGSVMVGSDGHRGWVYYLSVRTAHQNGGLGSELMRAAEEWLRRQGAVKIQLMVRKGNDTALRFYEGRGYETSDVDVLSKWLTSE
jgi:ribosomal protein S18 acetylase RimI-like enzyme